uniref:Putative uncharacterized protein YLR463C n=1 Tax=Saccharomyces cerevisiae (strain ATCC 204508 / S288c) TaxID=559292 RepID=YL463_YEAST|nr:RecName: Full=Putative uncharacterized protein YLR463C [Saccharomyces cerevisiae S288C]AAB64727.1 Ylr463cp [Saccharomyces cerevisiae]
MGSSFVIDRSSSSPAPPRGPAPKLSAHARKIICKISPNRSFLFIISLHICEKYFISMGLRGHRSRFSRSVSTFFSPGKLACIAHLRVGCQIVPIFPYGAFLKTPYNRCAGNKVSESTHRRAVVRPSTRYFVTTFQDTETQLIIVSSVEVKKRKGIVILSIEFQSMHLKQRVDHQVDFLGNKIL